MSDIYREVVLKVIQERPWKEGKGFGAWVIQKVKNDKSFEITVRSGMYRTDAVTGEKVYPRDGLNLKDFDAISPIYKTEIKPLLAIPKDTPVLPAGEALAQPEPPEEAPW